jgi:hypothetical protein
MEYIKLKESDLELIVHGMTHEQLDNEKYKIEGLQVELLMNTMSQEESDLYRKLDHVYCLMNYYGEEIWQFYWKQGILDEKIINNATTEFIEKTRTQKRSQLFKEELMAVAWHPDRIERLLNEGYSFEVVFGD